MKTLEAYIGSVQSQIASLLKTERASMDKAAGYVATALGQERFVYAFGSGHSHALGEEIFYRAGGLARAVAILDEKLMLHESASGGGEWERKEGYAETILARYDLRPGDALFVISNSGRNAVPIEMAIGASARGAKVAAIVSLRHSGAFLSRHSSGKKLADVADVVIDNGSVAGDARIQIAGLPQRVGPTSSVTSGVILNAVIVEGIARAVAAGVIPEVYGSINTDAGNNEALLAKYKPRIPCL